MACHISLLHICIIIDRVLGISFLFDHPPRPPDPRSNLSGKQIRDFANAELVWSRRNYSKISTVERTLCTQMYKTKGLQNYGNNQAFSYYIEEEVSLSIFC